MKMSPSIFPRMFGISIVCLVLFSFTDTLGAGDSGRDHSRGKMVLDKTNSTPSTTVFTPNNVEANLQSNGLLFSSANDPNMKGGAFLSADNGLSWTRVDSGLTNTNVFAFAVSPVTGVTGVYNLFAGTYGSGVFLSTDNGTSWTAVNSGLPPNTVVRSFAVSTGSGGTNLFAGTDTGGVFLSTNNGTNWTAVNAGLTRRSVRSLLAYSSGGTGATYLLAGTTGAGIFLSTDNGTSWTAITSGLPSNTSVDAFAVSSTSGGSGTTNLFAGTSGNGVFLSTDNGVSWTAAGSEMNSNYISSLVFSGSTLFAGTFGSGVFRSTNNGVSWAAANSGLPISVTCLGASESYIFAGTNGNVFRSSDNGDSWAIVGSGLTDTYVVNALACSGTNIFFGGTPLGSNAGLFWPKGSRNTPVFSAGLWIIGRSSLDGQLHSSVCQYRTEFQPGPIMGTYNGDTTTIPSIAGDPANPAWNIMTLSRSTASSDPTYELWASGAVPGAPLTPDGKPRIFGDQAAYWVMNDLNLSGHASTGRTTPMGLEVHNYFFGSNESEAISNTIFMGMNIINKSTITYDSTFIGFFSDTDLGDYGDDYTGCDTVRSLGYTYNEGSVDAVYGAACPAAGYDFIEGPMVPGTPTDSAIVNGKWLKGYRNLPMTAFTKFINGGGVYNDPPLGNSDYTRQAYNLLNGYIGQSGAPFKDPNGHPSKFVDPGDPVTGTGWLASFEAGPADTRELLASGPFTLQPGDTQEVFIAFVIGQGTDPLNSITILRRYDDSVQMALYNGFSTLSGVQKDKGVGVPEKYSLSQNYPNPFNPSTRIRYTLPNRCNVKIVIMNTLGQEVGVLENGERSAGYHEAVWYAKVASGMYFYRIEAIGISNPNTRFTQVKKMVLLK